MTLLKQSPTLRAAGRVGRVCAALGAAALGAAALGARALTAAPQLGRVTRVNAALGHKHSSPEQGQGGRYLGARCCSCQCAAQECC